MLNGYTREQAVDALLAIPATIDHDIRARIGMGAKAAGIRFDDYNAWQSANPRYDAAEVRSMWQSFTEGPVKAGTLFSIAKEHGWAPTGSAPRTAPERIRKPIEPTQKPAPGKSADEVWSRCQPATAEHPYVKRKKLADAVISLLRVVPADDPLTRYRGWLAVPGYSIDGVVQTIEFVPPESGKKMTLKGSQKSGAIFTVGPNSGPIVVVEGLATASAVFSSTGGCAISTFGCSNTRKAVEDLRQREPATRIIIAPDVGQEDKARAIAAEFNCAVAPMPDGWPANSDLNDLFCSPDGGFDVVQAMLEAATEPPVTYPVSVAFADELPDRFDPPDELIEGVLTAGDGSIWYGDSNSGKTFAVIDAGASVARGVPWMGKRTEAGMVVYLAAESPASVRGRLQAYQKHHGCKVPNFAIVQSPIDLFDGDADTNRVITLVHQLERQRGQKVRLIIGDTLARLSAGANENAGQDMGLVVRRFDRIRAECKAHFVLIHHSGKAAAAGARGWSGVRAAVDTEIEITDSPIGRCLEITKQRDLGTKGERIGFRLDVVALGHTKWGVPATSCVVAAADAPVKQAKAIKLGETQQAVMALLRGAGKNMRIKEIAEQLAPQDISKTSVYNAVNRLRDVELLEVSNGMVHLIGGKP